MCESYNLQYGTNFISVMPTNLYGPNDNFDLEKSHVLPALIRKMHLGKALENDDWDNLRKDLDKLPIEGIDGNGSETEILEVLSKYGITTTQNPPATPAGGKPKTPNTVSVEIWGSGKPMREFLWSEDMADACVFLMENRDFSDTYASDQKEIRNTHINIGTGKDVSIKELAELVKFTTGFKGDLVFNADKPDGTMKKLTDVSKLNSLGWSHSIELQDGVKRIYNWYVNPKS